MNVQHMEYAIDMLQIDGSKVGQMTDSMRDLLKEAVSEAHQSGENNQYIQF